MKLFSSTPLIDLGYSPVEKKENQTVKRLISLLKKNRLIHGCKNIEKGNSMKIEDNFFLICHAQPYQERTKRYRFLSNTLNDSNWWNDHFFNNQNIKVLYLFCCYGYNAFFWANSKNKLISQEGILAYRERLDFTLAIPEMKKMMVNYINNIRKSVVKLRYTRDFYDVVIAEKEKMIAQLDIEMESAHKKKDEYKYTMLELQLAYGFQSHFNLNLNT